MSSTLPKVLKLSWFHTSCLSIKGSSFRHMPPLPPPARLLTSLRPFVHASMRLCCRRAPRHWWHIWSYCPGHHLSYGSHSDQTGHQPCRHLQRHRERLLQNCSTGRLLRPLQVLTAACNCVHILPALSDTHLIKSCQVSYIMYCKS